MMRIRPLRVRAAGASEGSEIGREVGVDLAAARDLDDLRGLPLHHEPPWFLRWSIPWMAQI
jgi:hypothetical protein